MYPSTFETTRLRLHFLDLSNENDVANIIRIYDAWAKHPGATTRADIESKCVRHGIRRPFCTKLSETDALPPPICLVHLKSTDEFIGMVGMSCHAEMPCPDLGYSLLEPFTGKGYASEAARAGLEFWMNEIGLKDVLVVTTYENVKSQAVAKRAGFVDAGRLTAHWSNGQVDVRHVLMLPHMTWPSEGLVTQVKDSPPNARETETPVEKA